VNLSTTGGIIYGVNSLFELMNKELGGLGQLHEKCKNPPKDCTQRDNVYSNMFNIAVGFGNVGTAAIGILMDYLGPKAAAIIGLIFFAAGNYLVATTDSSKDEVNLAIAKFTTGFALIAMGGMGTYISSYNIANVTKFETTITSLIAAIFNLTGLTYFLFGIILDKLNMPIDKQRNFIGLLFTYTSAGQAVLIYLFWPVRAFAPNSDVGSLTDFRFFKPTKIKDDQMSLLKGEVSNERAEDSLFSNEIGHKVSGNEEYVPLRKESAKMQLLSKEFMLATVFYSLSLLAMSFYLGTIFSQVDGKAD